MTLPVLWHIKISHYSEKARWALAYKGVEHERRAPLPGAHMAVALALTRGRSHTFPVLTLDGAHIGDSTAIIAALEQRHPEPPLYPADPRERERALRLEDWFDTELGPALRRLVWHEVNREPGRMEALAPSFAPPPLLRFRRFAATAGRQFVNLRYGADDADGAQIARANVLAALDRLEAELDGDEHLAGDCFSIADLTAAALFYPLVLPQEGPRAFDPLPPRLQQLRDELADRPGYRWVERTYRRHRHPRAPAAATASLG